MDNYERIQQLQKEMRRHIADIRLEPQVVLAMEKGIQADDFLVSCDSSFFREYSKDLLCSEIKEDAGKKSLLQFHLTRSGISDQLPEGIFFQPGNNRRSGGAADMAVDYKKNKQQTQEVRKFFMPFENDFFWQRLQAEAEEFRLLEGLQSGLMNDYFIKFWGIPSSIEASFTIPLILLLPHAHKIAGNLELTATCLELILGEKVAISLQEFSGPVVTDGPVLRLENLTLGLNMICGNNFEEDTPILTCSIGPLQQSTVAEYLENGNRFILLKTFYDFFIPALASVTTSILVKPEIQQMKLGKDVEPVLGYSSFLSP